jgi:hypothetical protein
MTERFRGALPATLIAWIAQAAVAALFFTMMADVADRVSSAGYSVFFAESMTCFLIIYMPQFLILFVPASCLLRKLQRNGPIASVLAGIVASLIGIGLNYLWLTPFATPPGHFDGLELFAAYTRLHLIIVAVSGGAAAGCSYWLCANIKIISEARNA